MKDIFAIEGVPYFSQRDNEVKPSVSCFPTSMGMVIAYCLGSAGLDKSAIGCQPDQQIEDFLNGFMDSDVVTQWMKKNTPTLGAWIWEHARREIHMVEEFAFNQIMNKVGFKSTLKWNMTFKKFAEKIEGTGLPMVVGGNFKSVSSVGGHMVCAVGYDSRGGQKLVVNDPWGDALTGYGDRVNGAYRTYDGGFFFKGEADNMYMQVIERA